MQRLPCAYPVGSVACNILAPWLLAEHQVAFDHLHHELLEIRLVAPAELRPSLGSVAEQLLDLCWPEIARINAHEVFSCPHIDSDLVNAMSAPADTSARVSEGELDEFPDRMHLPRCQHIIVGLRLLQHQPHTLDEVARMPPVTLGLQVAEIKAFLAAARDFGNGAGDFSGHKRLTAHRAFVVKQDAVRGVQ